MTSLQITPLRPSIGAEIAGVDLSKPIDETTRQALNRALADHLALVFHDQSLTPEQYLAAASVFGTPIEHPMVRTHPVHGSRAVYFHISKATHISGMTPHASKAYMAELIERMIGPEIVYHHVWKKGDVLIIDDRATMHRAHGDYDRSESRVLWRIIVEGDRPRLV